MSIRTMGDLQFTAFVDRIREHEILFQLGQFVLRVCLRILQDKARPSWLTMVQRAEVGVMSTNDLGMVIMQFDPKTPIGVPTQSDCEQIIYHSRILTGLPPPALPVSDPPYATPPHCSDAPNLNAKSSVMHLCRGATRRGPQSPIICYCSYNIQGLPTPPMDRSYTTANFQSYLAPGRLVLPYSRFIFAAVRFSHIYLQHNDTDDD
ncbi:hypothetical protein BDR04DRAFT_1234293 [Suillus decipiens]|nr:hypothetical protein BDR04DRAFT_1234293 [Suillus decipiens]